MAHQTPSSHSKVYIIIFKLLWFSFMWPKHENLLFLILKYFTPCAGSNSFLQERVFLEAELIKQTLFGKHLAQFSGVLLSRCKKKLSLLSVSSNYFITNQLFVCSQKKTFNLCNAIKGIDFTITLKLERHVTHLFITLY